MLTKKHRNNDNQKTEIVDRNSTNEGSRMIMDVACPPFDRKPRKPRKPRGKPLQLSEKVWTMSGAKPQIEMRKVQTQGHAQSRNPVIAC